MFIYSIVQMFKDVQGVQRCSKSSIVQMFIYSIVQMFEEVQVVLMFIYSIVQLFIYSIVQ